MMENNNLPRNNVKNSTAEGFLIFNSQIIPITIKIIKIGRHMDNDVIIPSDAVSRWHASLKLEDDHFVLYDEKSTSGTFVNNKQIERCLLTSGDMISLADVQIMFVNNAAKLRDQTLGQTKGLNE